MGASLEFPLEMLFRKEYCAYCGERLTKKLKKNVFRPGDSQFKRFIGRGIINFRKYTVCTLQYFCPNCNKEFSYDLQIKYSALQKRFGLKMLPPHLMHNRYEGSDESEE